MSYDVTDFRKEVIQRSLEIPVLVDFWAEWCGPCKILGPILEKLERVQSEQWVLAKVDTDKHPDLSAEYGIRGIPNVKLFVDGKVTAEFAGALPEYVVVQWLKKHLPDSLRKSIEEVKNLLANGKSSEAQLLLEKLLEQDPTHESARILLAGLVMRANRNRALMLIDGIEEDSEQYQQAEAVRTYCDLVEKYEQADSLPESKVKTLYIEALREFKSENFEKALEKFIEVIRTDRSYDEDGARKACIAIFRMLGDEHEITRTWRRRFSSALNV